jgi:hypothetical protein
MTISSRRIGQTSNASTSPGLPARLRALTRQYKAQLKPASIHSTDSHGDGPVLCWLLVASVGQNWAVRTPTSISCSLPIPQRKSTISSIDSHIFTKGNGHCAWDSHPHEAVDRPLSSIAQRPLRRLGQTRHHLAPAWDAERPFQEQVPTRGRKRAPASTTDHPASTSETTCLYQNGPHAPGATGKNGEDLETSPRHHSARDEARAGIARVSSSCGSTSRRQLLSSQGYPRRRSP